MSFGIGNIENLFDIEKIPKKNMEQLIMPFVLCFIHYVIELIYQRKLHNFRDRSTVGGGDGDLAPI